MTKEERCRAAKAYREKGLNCAQCLLATFRDVAGLTEQQALGLGAGLGGGVRCGGICGAVSARCSSSARPVRIRPTDRTQRS